jgi:hypothetical protein
MITDLLPGAVHFDSFDPNGAGQQLAAACAQCSTEPAFTGSANGLPQQHHLPVRHIGQGKAAPGPHSAWQPADAAAR